MGIFLTSKFFFNTNEAGRSFNKAFTSKDL